MGRVVILELDGATFTVTPAGARRRIGPTLWGLAVELYAGHHLAEVPESLFMPAHMPHVGFGQYEVAGRHLCEGSISISAKHRMAGVLLGWGLAVGTPDVAEEEVPEAPQVQSVHPDEEQQEVSQSLGNPGYLA